MRFISLLMAATIPFSGCSKNVRAEKPESDVKTEEKAPLLDRILEINRNAPSSFRASFVIEGTIKKNKKFKSLGKAEFLNSPLAMQVSFIDFIFRSPLTVLAQDGNVLKFYFPAEKKLYLDRADGIDMREYVEIAIPFRFIQMLITCRIPLIDDYTVKSRISEKDTGKPGNGGKYVIIENGSYFQTISFDRDIPNKILLVSKNSREKMEFYLQKPFRKNNILAYRQIKFISLKTGQKAVVNFSSIDFNVRLDAKKVSGVKTDKNTQTIRVR